MTKPTVATNDAAMAKKKALENPKWFFNKILRFPAMQWQLDAVNVILDLRRQNPRINLHKKPRLTIRSCHGTGKTQLLAMIMHIWNFTTYGKIACTAPKQQQLTKRLMPRYRGSARNAIPTYKNLCRALSTEVVFNNDPDWGAVMETASDPESLAGYHDKPQLFLVDEASSKRLDPMFPTIEGALSTPGSCIVEIGNPTRMEGEFYTHHNGKACNDMYYRMHVKPSDAPEIISQQWLDDMAAKYGKQSPIYKIRCLGEFAAFDEYILINLEHLEESYDSDHQPDGSHPSLRVSIDVADGGADSTIITAARHYDSYVEILSQTAHYFEPSKAVIEAAKAGIRVFDGFEGRKNLDDFVIDANGVGAGTAGYLMENDYNVIRHVGGEASDYPDLYRNRRVQNYIALEKNLREYKVKINTDAIDDLDELESHILSIKRRVSNEKVDDLEPKEAIKKLGLPSPDRADSLSMQFIDKIHTNEVSFEGYGAVGAMQSINYG